MRNMFILAMLVLGTGFASAQHGGDALTTADVTPELIILGTTGNPGPFADAVMGVAKGKLSGAFVATEPNALSIAEMNTNAGYFGYAPEVAVVGHLTYRMVAPAHVPDNFVVTCRAGWTRYDLGVDEGTNELTIVSMGKY